MISVLFPLLLVSISSSNANAAPEYPFTVDGATIRDSDNQAVQFRCLNWAGHISSNLPEGLNNNSDANILDIMASEDDLFNCLRINYSVELMVNEEVKAMTARQSLTNNNHQSDFADLSKFVGGFEQQNPDLIDSPILDSFIKIVEEANKRNIFILFDNTVSLSSWCCSFTDGNGWFNDTYFDVDEWLQSLSLMATTFKDYSNVVAFSLRNEFRYDTSTRPKTQADLVSDWMQYVRRRASKASGPTSP